MATSKDSQRTAAFRGFLRHIGDDAAAAERTGVASRTIQRMRAGRQPPPVGLLDRCAELAARDGATGLAETLRDAAAPSGDGNDA